ncbi:MAG: type I restriction enzyme HsdR N-terminal domain-containing protein [Salibacteraceae bacterium]
MLKNTLIDRKKYPPLNLPFYEVKVRRNEQQIQIFDRFRKKFIALTPEEWVRQHFANYLVNELNYPQSRLHIEFQMKYDRRLKRPDIAVIDDQGKYEILVECKAPHIKLDEAVFLQLTTYFSVLKPSFIVMTNGIHHIIGTHKPNEKNFVYIDTLPAYL